MNFIRWADENRLYFRRSQGKALGIYRGKQ